MGFRNRADAGRQLADQLSDLRGQPDLFVLGIPRGGVVVAAEIATTLHAPLGALIVHKIGAPGNSEYAVGGVSLDGSLWVDWGVVDGLGISREYIEAEGRRQHAQLQDRARRIGATLDFALLRDKTVLVVDDGIATGATIRVAVPLLRGASVASLVLAVPVAPPGSEARFREPFDRVHILLEPGGFLSVGQFYADFAQVDDTEVKRLLEQHRADRNP